MNTHADKTQENKNQAVSNGASQMQGGSEGTFQFVDNRPKAVAQQKLQEMVNNSRRTMQLKAIQEIANNSPQAKQAAQLQAMADNRSVYPIQKQELVEEELLQGKFKNVQRQELEEAELMSNKVLQMKYSLSSTPRKMDIDRFPIHDEVAQTQVVQRVISKTILTSLAAIVGIGAIALGKLILDHGPTGAWISLNALSRRKTLQTSIADLVVIWDRFPDLGIGNLIELGGVGITLQQATDMEARMGGFEQVGEGFMTTYNMVASDFRVGNDHNNADTLNQRIDHWEKEGFGNQGQEPADISALNEIYGINGEADARQHSSALIHAYSKLASSQTQVGKDLATRLAYSGTNPIRLRDAQGAEHNKQVKLKLIIRPGIPGQFLSPFEQDISLDQCIALQTPIPAVIMWDPQLNFTYYKPREGSEGLGENDPARRGDVETMESWVVLAHELGHFTDFLDRPNDFNDRLVASDIDTIEEWNLPREQDIVRNDLGKTPRDYYQDFPGGKNDKKIAKD